MKKNATLALLITSMLVCSFISFRPWQTFDLKSSITRGQEVYITYCLSCHLQEGVGIENLYPPLAKSDYLMSDKKRSIQQVLYGANEAMTVNGKSYTTPMPGFELTDDQASDVLNYIRNSWKNKGSAITPGDIKSSRK